MDLYVTQQNELTLMEKTVCYFTRYFFDDALIGQPSVAWPQKRSVKLTVLWISNTRFVTHRGDSEETWPFYEQKIIEFLDAKKLQTTLFKMRHFIMVRY